MKKAQRSEEAELKPVETVAVRNMSAYDDHERAGIKLISEEQVLPVKPINKNLQPITLLPVRKDIPQTAGSGRPGDEAPGHESVQLEKLQEELVKSLSEVLNMEEEDVDICGKFIDMGLDSITGVEWIRAINKQYGVSVKVTRVYDYPSLQEFAIYLAKELSLQEGNIPVTPHAPSSNVLMQQKSQLPGSTVPKEHKDVSERLFPKQAAVQGNVRLLQAVVTLEKLQDELVKSLAEVLNMEMEDVDMYEKFTDMGLDSITGVEWIQAINKRYGVLVKVTRIYDYPSLQEFAVYLQEELSKQGCDVDELLSTAAPPVSLDDLLERVSMGNLEIEQADELISHYILMEE